MDEKKLERIVKTATKVLVIIAIIAAIYISVKTSYDEYGGLTKDLQIWEFIISFVKYGVLFAIPIMVLYVIGEILGMITRINDRLSFYDMKVKPLFMPKEKLNDSESNIRKMGLISCKQCGRKHEMVNDKCPYCGQDTKDN